MADDEVLRKLGELVSCVRTVQGQQSEILANQANHSEAQEQLGARFKLLEIDVKNLQRLVHGSTPPPPDGNAAPLVDAVAEVKGEAAAAKGEAAAAKGEASSASLDVAGLEGRMIAGIAGLRKELVDMLTAQDRVLGVGARGVRAFFSPPVLRQLPAVIAAVAALAAALRGAPAPAPVAASPVAPVHVSAQR